MSSPHVHTARLKWPDAEWIIGTGPFASLAGCGCLTVMLFETQAEADTAKAFIDNAGCGGACIGLHRVEKIEERVA